MKVKVRIFAQDLKHGFGLPQYESDGAAGMDIRANASVFIAPGETKIVPTGLFVGIPEGYEIQVRPRSGLSLKTKMRVPNAPGTVDSDYRGELGVIVENTGDTEVHIAIADRIVQIVLQEVPSIQWERVSSIEALGETERGANGYGSTDVKATAGAV